MTFRLETVAVENVVRFPTMVENVILDARIVDMVPMLPTCNSVVLVVLPVRLEKMVLMVDRLIPFNVEYVMFRALRVDMYPTLVVLVF